MVRIRRTLQQGARHSVRRTASRSTAKRRSLSFRRKATIKLKPTVAREISAVIYLSFGVLTILSIKSAFGPVGDAWVNLLKPIFGWGLYAIPVVLIAISVMLFFSKKIDFGPTRTFGIILFIISTLSVLHLSVPINEIRDYASVGGYGGYVGFVTNFLFLEVLGVGTVGASIIFIALFLISLLLIFEISLVELISYAIPRIKIERENERRKEKAEDEDEFDEIPEEPAIFIHKTKINNVKSDVAVVYDEDGNVAPAKETGSKDEKVDDVEKQLEAGSKKAPIEQEYTWEFPSLDLLTVGDSNVTVDEAILKENAEKIRQKLKQFDIEVMMHEVNVGPTVVQYTLKPHEAVKLSKITSLKNDIALALAAERVRIEAPIPGKSLVGIEVPNSFRAIVHLRELLETEEFKKSKSRLTLPMGRDVSGQTVIADLETMPHLLIAGATGSGKSVAMNAFLLSLLYQNSPMDLRLILIDPKRVELTSYNNIPHLLTPVITDPEKAAVSLRWVVAEMSRRYNQLHDKRVRNINEYNALDKIEPLARIVVVVDELADLMMSSGKEVEASICRIAQMARAVGIHLIIATQRPSVDVITGLIKANIPARIAFEVSSSIDSRTILDGGGAEDLVGRGDMLYLAAGKNKPVRIQGIFVSTEEIERVTNRVKLTIEPEYSEEITSKDIAKQKLLGIPDSNTVEADDDLYQEAYSLVMETRKASASLLQRRLSVGYARAARLIDSLEANGVVGPADGAKPRRILSQEEI